MIAAVANHSISFPHAAEGFMGVKPDEILKLIVTLNSYENF